MEINRRTDCRTCLEQTFQRTSLETALHNLMVLVHRGQLHNAGFFVLPDFLDPKSTSIRRLEGRDRYGQVPAEIGVFLGKEGAPLLLLRPYIQEPILQASKIPTIAAY